MQGNHLRAQEILPWGNALRNPDGMSALPINNPLSAPNTITSQPVLLDLEPPTANTRVRSRVVDLLEVRDGRPLVRRVHDVVGRGARRGEHVPPEGCDGRAGLDGDHLGGGGCGVGVAIAGDGVGGHVLDGAVVGRDADALALALVDAAYFEGLEDCVGRGQAGCHEGGDELHVGWLCGDEEEMFLSGLGSGILFERKGIG